MPSLDKRLQEILDQLPEAQVQQLLEYAQFLLARHGAKNPNVEPLVIPRPAEESVVKAIQRLRETYPMLDPAKLLNETAALMMQHVMQGRDASVVIDELEVLFQRHYRKVKPGS